MLVISLFFTRSRNQQSILEFFVLIAKVPASKKRFFFKKRPTERIEPATFGNFWKFGDHLNQLDHTRLALNSVSGVTDFDREQQEAAAEQEKRRNKKNQHQYSRSNGHDDDDVSSTIVIINHYDILGVARNASLSEITRSFRTAALKLHPDKWSGKSEEEKKRAEESFKMVNNAYSVLRDEKEREKYDQTLV